MSPSTKDQSTPDPPGGRKPGIAGALSALQYHDFRLYFISGLGLTASQGLEQLALAWLVLDLTDSIGQLGLSVFVRGVPMAIIALFGGVLADRYNRRLLLVYTQSGTMVVLAVLAGLTLSGAVEVWHVYVGSTVLGIQQALTMPARQAMVRNLVQDEALMNAVALNTIQQNSARVLWPSVAGGLIAWQGVGSTLVICSLCYIVAIVFLLMIREQASSRARTQTSAVREVFEAFRYIAVTPLVATVAIMMTAIAMFGLAFLQMGPAFGREVLGFNAGVTGLFIMASGIGSIIGSSVLLAVEVKNRTGMFVLLAACFALLLLALSVNPWTPGAFLIMGGFGACNASLVILGQTIFQVSVPDQYLGRVMSLWSFTGGLGLVTALPMGVAGDAFGLRWALGGAAVMLLLLTVVVGVVRAPWRVQSLATADIAT